MVYKIIKDSELVNIIESDEHFARSLSEEIGGTYELDERIVPPHPKERTAQDDIDEMIVDHEFRLTMLELGV